MSSGIKVTIAYGDNEQVAEVPAGKPLTVTVEFAGKKAEVGVSPEGAITARLDRVPWTLQSPEDVQSEIGSEVRNTTSS